MMTLKRDLFVGILISMLLMVVALPVKALDDSLLLYLPFDSDTARIATDVTGKTKGGKIIGGTKVIPTGAHGRALELNGTSGFVEIELTAEMIEAERNSFTAELWLQTRAQGIPVADGPDRFVGLGIFGGFGPKTHFQGHWSMNLLEDNLLRFFVVNANGFVNDGKPGVIVRLPPINDGKWHHIAAVRDEDNKEMRVYIDGLLVGEAEDLTRALNSKPDHKNRRKKIWLGNHLELFWSVRFDEVRFWNKAMNQDEVSANMTSFAVHPFEKLPLKWGDLKERHIEGY